MARNGKEQPAKAPRSSAISWVVAASAALAILATGMHLAQKTQTRRADAEPSKQSQPATSRDAGERGILPRDEPSQSPEPSSEEASEATSPYWPALGRASIGLLLGFCVAYTLKTFLKLTILMSLLAVGLLIGLGQTPALDLDLSVLADWLGRAGRALAGQFDSIRAFLTGLIPAGGSTIAGAALGILKR
jgi:uncharacterized membrane protein (Fun14 family)